MTDRLISTREVARVLGVSEATVKRWADAHVLTHIRTPGGHRKFRLRDIAMPVPRGESPPAPSSGSPEELDDSEVEALKGALMVADLDSVLATIKDLRSRGESYAPIVDRWLYPAFDRIVHGSAKGWCPNYHVHLAVSCLTEAAARQTPALRTSSHGATMLCCPVGAGSSEVLAWMASLVGWESGHVVMKLGVGLAPSELRDAAHAFRAEWLWMVGDGSDAEAQLRLVKGVAELTKARRVLWTGPASARLVVPSGVAKGRDFREAALILKGKSQQR